MLVQRIEFPVQGEENSKEMYLRADASVYQINDEEMLVLKPQGKVLFNTYFNSFSVEKWMKYTRISNLEFRYWGKGRILVSIWNAYVDEKNRVKKDLLVQTDFSSREIKENRISISLNEKLHGIIYAEFENQGDTDCEFGSGGFFTEAEAAYEIYMVLDICTYKREEYLYHNLDIIRDKLWNNPQSSLYGKIHVIVADNGRTLKNAWKEEWLSVYPNKNAGGTAGFTRGILEALDKDAYTHVLLMDDDVKIKPSALEKTYIMLGLLKEEYRESFIGGAMLRRDYGFVQQESGGQYRDGRIISLHGGMNLCDEENVLRNETEKQADYNAWWYCCMPVSLIKKNGLPLPLFIHNDDVEYGIRCKKDIILMNGICVWHEAFENKRPSVNEYYDIRNTFIMNAVHQMNFGRGRVFKILCRRMLTNLFRYRYKDICMNERAFYDFLKGPGWLMETDAENLHKELMGAGYSYKEEYKEAFERKEKVNLEQILSGKNNSNQIDKKKLLSLNGWLLPAFKSTLPVPVMAGESPHAYYRRKKVWIYDPDSERGFYSQKKMGQLFVLVWKLVKIFFHILIQYEKVRRQYEKQMGELTSHEFWNKYLGLKGEKE